MAWPNVLLLLALLAGQTPPHPAPYPRPGTTQVLENDAIAVWDVAWLKQKYPLHTGNTHVEEGASDPPMRAILMEVKTAAGPVPDAGGRVFIFEIK
jgi:hypothetical protein